MKHLDRNSQRIMLLTGFVSLLTLNSMAIAGNSETGNSNCADDSKLKDTWVEARLESAYLFNPNLNNFGIDTEVENGNVQLKGTVGSDIDRDLAVEIARSLDDVTSVDSQLVVKEDLSPETVNTKPEDRKFSQMVADATITAMVKTKLMANTNVSGTAIDVDTDNNVVVLSGQVESAAEKQLAEYIAGNTSGVESVDSHLTIVESS